MATAHEFGAFTVETARKPIGGVVEGEIPEALSAYLEVEVPKVMADNDHELIIRAASEKDAKLLAGYSRAWGARQTPQLYIRKIANGTRYPENVARMSVKLDEEVGPDGRPGRKVAEVVTEPPAEGQPGVVPSKENAKK
jgi:hypothetical protein